VGEAHFSAIIPKVELYCFNIGRGVCSEWEEYTSVPIAFLILMNFHIFSAYNSEISSEFCIMFRK
jgi:hypothetical protein